ncbi:MAG: transglycosylase SLT domain-containing protein [Bacteroidota bacterium]
MREQLPISPSASRRILLRLPLSPRRIGYLLLLILGSNVLTHSLFNQKEEHSSIERVAYHPPSTPLYLMQQAAQVIPGHLAFEQKVREIAVRLQIAPEWLMAVMYAESSFEASVFNRKGSGAVGLIQFMPATAQELGTSSQELASLDPVNQLEYVYRYFAQVEERYGEYVSLTDVYLAVLYPKARRQDPCYLLYAKPSRAYQMNSGLDENKDGVVTVSDIDTRMRRLFPVAYHAAPKMLSQAQLRH